MNFDLRTLLAPTVFATFTAAACGGGTPPADSPASTSAAASSAAAPASTAAAPAETPAEPAAGDPAKKGAGAAPAASAPASKRSARDILELKETVFFLAFAESDPGKAAEASCTKSAGKDPKKKAACM